MKLFLHEYSPCNETSSLNTEIDSREPISSFTYNARETISYIFSETITKIYIEIDSHETIS